MYVNVDWNQSLVCCCLHTLKEIKLGEADVVLSGGTESMSQSPYALRNVRWGSPLGVDLKVSVCLLLWLEVFSN